MSPEFQSQHVNRNNIAQGVAIASEMGRTVMDRLAHLQLPFGTAHEWGERAQRHGGAIGAVGVMAAVGTAAYKLAERAEQESREAQKKKQEELDRKKNEEEWARVNGASRSEYSVTQERGKHGELQAEKAVAQNQARQRRLDEAQRPGASPEDRRYARERQQFDPLGGRRMDDDQYS